ncbi:hypothetical protein [Kineococcus esterisolvens]|uniref:hypothetical protein n=1 Tax=unclassified Kineococcus TaxID=2621656 RepID=UPI003D7C7A4E
MPHDPFVETVRTTTADDSSVPELVTACPESDLAEAGVDTITSPVLVPTGEGAAGEVLAVAGHEH